MSYYIIETKTGPLAVDGVFLADQIAKKMRERGGYASVPRIANPYDIIDKACILRLEYDKASANLTRATA